MNFFGQKPGFSRGGYDQRFAAAGLDPMGRPMQGGLGQQLGGMGNWGGGGMGGGLQAPRLPPVNPPRLPMGSVGNMGENAPMGRNRGNELLMRAMMRGRP